MHMRLMAIAVGALVALPQAASYGVRMPRRDIVALVNRYHHRTTKLS